MAINVVLTSLKYNPTMLIATMEAAPVAGEEPVLGRFFALWFTAIQERKFTGVHNRKLGILALCALLEVGYTVLPPYIQRVIPHTFEMLTILFEKLPHAYDLLKREEEDSSDIEYEEEDIDDEAGLDDHQDYEDEDDELIRSELSAFVGLDGSDDESDDELDEGQFKQFKTRLDDSSVDEYATFSNLVSVFAQKDPAGAEAAMSILSQEVQAKVSAIVELNTKRMQSRKAATTQSDGFAFVASPDKPSSFNFGAH